MFEDLIKYEDLHEACADMFGFGVVEFLRDFGPWKKDDKVDTMWFMLETGVAEEQSEDGIVIKSYKFKLV